MSSLGPKVIAMIVPCTLVACADKYRASQYAPGLENEGVNSEQYQPVNPRRMNPAKQKLVGRDTQAQTPPQTAQQPIAKPGQQPPPNQVPPPPSRELEPQVQRIAPTQRLATSQPRLQRFDPIQPNLIPEIEAKPNLKPSQQYFERPPKKPMAFRPGIQPGSSLQPLLWEKGKADSVMWSTYARQVIGDKASQALLPGAEDIEEFCPRYNAIENRDLKINFWAYLISAIAEVESSFDPANRMSEPGLGIDKVTNKQVVSEGLLQLSYQDTKWYPACEFDWESDRKLAAEDERKTILDPFKNLKCGISILANQIKNRRRISIVDGYWSVLRPDGRKYSKVNQIKRRTKQLSFCS